MLNRSLLKYDKFINMLKGIFDNGQWSKDICKTIMTLEFFVIIPSPTAVGQGIFYAADNTPVRTYAPRYIAGSVMHNYIYNVDV